MHCGPTAQYQLILLAHQGHYDVITRLNAYFGVNYFCLQCRKGYKTRDFRHHRCPGFKCYCCLQTDCSDFATRHARDAATELCPHCHRRFFGPRCLELHTIRSPSGDRVHPLTFDNVCAQLRCCGHCGRTFKKFQDFLSHLCGYQACYNCKATVDVWAHKCFIQPIQNRRGPKRKHPTSSTDQPGPVPEEEQAVVKIFFDCECMQEGGEAHRVNLVCAETSLDDRRYQFPSMQDFMAWVWNLRVTDPGRRPFVLIAHNFQGYDGYLLLEELYKQAVVPSQIVNGAKLLSVSIPGDIKFIDSLNFFPMALASFPQTFGLQEEAKGFFPHFFNIPTLQQYVGAMPDKQYYDPDGMKPARRADFERWYADQVASHRVFNLQAELLKYCQSDVRILKQACTLFEREFRGICGFDPFEQCITIASACNVAYRRHWMRPRTLAVEPLHGWHPQIRQSRVALEWLYHLERILPPPTDGEPRLRHSRNGGEVLFRIGERRYHADGYDPRTGFVYEFYGCFYHGCPECFPQRHQRHAKLDGATPHELYTRTVQRAERIRQGGHVVIEKWECEWEAQKREDPELRLWAETLDLVTPLDPRDAFFGGRTEAVRAHCQAQPDQHIFYDDFTSLYPWVNKNCKYPVGHPVIHTQFTCQTPEDWDRLVRQQSYGLVQCRVLPPHYLFHPVLPVRVAGKLLFPLCVQCARRQVPLPWTERTHICDHTPRERAFVGTWCTPELVLALDQGYVILHIYELWDFRQTSTTLFRDYINTWIKVKQEADGWPSPEVEKDPALQIEYLEEFRRVEGVILDPAKIERNEGRRTLGKLMANSFWGKFGQRTNKTQVTTCKDPETFFDLFLDGERDIHRILPAGDQMIDVYHSFKEDVGELGTNTNIFVAAFTTAHARVKLYQDGLLPLDTRVLYMDTDSVVYLATQGETHLPRGRFLGQFKDELKGDVIDEFVAGGPKNYAYRTRSGQECCKVRGFTLDARGQAVLNFESVRNLVQKDIDEPLDRPRTLSVDNPHHIVRNVTDKTLHSVPQRKTYSMVQDKRVLDASTGMTYPYGYRPSQDIVDDMVLSVLFSDVDSPYWGEDLPFLQEPYPF